MPTKMYKRSHVGININDLKTKAIFLKIHAIASYKKGIAEAILLLKNLSEKDLFQGM